MLKTRLCFISSSLNIQWVFRALNKHIKKNSCSYQLKFLLIVEAKNTIKRWLGLLIWGKKKHIALLYITYNAHPQSSSARLGAVVSGESFAQELPSLDMRPRIMAWLYISVSVEPDQTARLDKLGWTNFGRIWHKTHFRMTRVIWPL